MAKQRTKLFHSNATKIKVKKSYDKLKHLCSSASENHLEKKLQNIFSVVKVFNNFYNFLLK